jgi:hypothetical protein
VKQIFALAKLHYQVYIDSSIDDLIERHDIRMVHVSQDEDFLMKSFRLSLSLQILFIIGFKSHNVTCFLVNSSFDHGKSALADLQTDLKVIEAECLTFLT